jgi:four helix bundle protein
MKLEKYVNDQLGIASYSIVLNIAEGCAKSSKADRKNYFIKVRAAVSECLALLDIIHQRKDLEEDEYLENLKLADETLTTHHITFISCINFIKLASPLVLVFL